MAHKCARLGIVVERAMDGCQGRIRSKTSRSRQRWETMGVTEGQGGLVDTAEVSKARQAELWAAVTYS